MSCDNHDTYKPAPVCALQFKLCIVRSLHSPQKGLIFVGYLRVRGKAACSSFKLKELNGLLCGYIAMWCCVTLYECTHVLYPNVLDWIALKSSELLLLFCCYAHNYSANYKRIALLYSQYINLSILRLCCIVESRSPFQLEIKFYDCARNKRISTNFLPSFTFDKQEKTFMRYNSWTKFDASSIERQLGIVFSISIHPFGILLLCHELTW